MATQACKKGSVRVNDVIAKPSRDVFPGDVISLRKDQINYQLEILDLPENRVGAKLVDLFRKDTTPKEAFETNEMLQYAKSYYRKKGVGRPTKKDRRDLEDFTDASESENDI
jgi:ribosome-associated heat shock protein Hsp15